MPRKRSKRQESDSDEDYENSSSGSDEDEVELKYVPERLEGNDGETGDFGEPKGRGSSGPRPKRKTTVKVVVHVKEEPQSDPPSDSGGERLGGEGDSDYLMNEDEEEEIETKKKRERGTPSKRKPVTEMSEDKREQQKKKWREEARVKRAKKRESMGVVKKEEGTREEKRRSSSKRKPVAEMSEEERERMKIKWREEARQRRAKKRESMGMSSGGEGEEEKGKGKILNRSGSGSQGGSGRRRKPVAEMDEEEREKMKVKWREEARQRRAKKKEMMTEEEKREEQKKQNEQRKKCRWRKMAAEGRKVRVKKEPGEKRRPLTEEEKEKKREWRRKWMENMSEEEKERRRAEKRELRRKQREGMSVEERRMKDYMDRQARLARMTKEEREELKERQRQRRLERMGGWEGNKEYQRKWREGMSEDQKARFRRQLRESYYRKMEKIKRDPVQLQEWRDRCRENYQRKVMRSLETGIPFRKSRKGGGWTTRRKGQSEEEWRRELVESSRLWKKRQEIKRRLEIQRLIGEGVEMEEICRRVDPYGGDEEKRRARLIRQRVNKQKLNLRRQLEGMGVEEEEIERRVAEVERTYQPTLQFRPFKLNSKSLEKVTPEEMKILEEEENKVRMGRFRVGARVELPQISPQQSSPPLRVRAPQQSARVPQSLPHQQSSTPAQQATYSLEHFMHGINFNYNTTAQHSNPPQYFPSTSTSTQNHPPPATAPQPYYHGTSASYSSSQHEYEQSMSNYTNSPPPASPLGGGDDDDYEDDHHSTSHFFFSPPHPPQQTAAPPMHPPQPPRPTKTKAQQLSSGLGPASARPKKPKRSLPHRKGCPGPPSGPRGPRRTKHELVRDVICEDCGNAYSRDYIQEHKRQLHNPNFVNGKCLTCGEAFTNANKWYKHFIKLHLGTGEEHEWRHRKPADPNKTGLFCDNCGVGFATRTGLSKHIYFIHGEGSKKENYIKCEICPEEKMFQSLRNLKNHMRKRHPDTTNEKTNECFRCEKNFRWEEGLSAHVQRAHPESYWPCKWCKACRFSKYGLNFHLRKCLKGGRGEVIGEGENLLEFDLGCEFCGKMMKMTSLTRHYFDVHEVRERETFKCIEEGCRGKGGTGEFRRRDYWVVHLEEKHGKKWEELREWVGKCNVEREGLVVRNEKGRKKMPEGGVRRREKREVREEDEEGMGKVRRKRRNVKVIAEEDLEELERQVKMEVDL